MKKGKTLVDVIEKSKGVLMDLDGMMHPFGIQSYGSANEMTSDNYHDSAFNLEIKYSLWFIELQKKLNFVYPNDTIYRQAMVMAGIGIVTILNACTLDKNNNEYNCFCVYVPEELSLDQKETFLKLYSDLIEMQKRKSAYIDFMAYDKKGEYAWDESIYDINEFYKKLLIIKGKRKIKNKL